MRMTSMGGRARLGAGRLLSPRQERVARRLLEQVAPGPAIFFRDACDLLAEGRLGDVKSLGGSPEVQLVGEHDERAQQTRITTHARSL